MALKGQSPGGLGKARSDLLFQPDASENDDIPTRAFTHFCPTNNP
jgi:hypothetical protein